MKKNLFTCLLALGLTLSATSLFAQPGFDDNEIVDTPIDGGVGVLMALSLVYGAKRTLSKDKNQSSIN
ncbi:MAG: hypothetical protein CFE21_12685 [Bacteroidetes bacterium B1(2017)]|nr:MAG: hypothetical protein CFE21_12685 [Bacteroidetes bacterium B1(2017)]